MRELDARLTATQREYEEKLRFVFEQLQVQTPAESHVETQMIHQLISDENYYTITGI